MIDTPLTPAVRKQWHVADAKSIFFIQRAWEAHA